MDLVRRLKQILRRFWPYTRKPRLLMGGSFLALLAEVFLRLIEPWMLALVLDYVILAPQDGAKALPLIGAYDPKVLLISASVGLVVTVGLRALAVYSSTVGSPSSATAC